MSKLLENIVTKKEGGTVIPFELNSGKFIFFSDQHKGGKDMADDFRLAEANYLSALKYYYENGFSYINLGDSEELWESTPQQVIEKNRLTLLEEAKFLQVGRYHRIYGNHDLEWKYSIQQNLFLKPIFGDKLKVCEGIVLQTFYNNQHYSIFLTHGHQGDKKSDKNPFSTWVVANIWTPIQRYFEVSIDTTSDSFELVNKHNIIMYDWSATQHNLLFITGHTHKPVFASLDHIERLTKQLEKATLAGEADKIKALEEELQRRQKEYAGRNFAKTMACPCYFNTGCCCFNDGDITGIEIEGDAIRLVKWQQESGESKKYVLEQSPLSYIFDQLK